MIATDSSAWVDCLDLMERRLNLQGAGGVPH